MDLVDEKNVAGAEVGEECGEVAHALYGWARGRAHRATQLAGYEVGERGLAEAWGPIKEDMLGRVAAFAGGSDEDMEVVFDALLADVLVP